jgi:hypothetical protein
VRVSFAVVLIFGMVFAFMMAIVYIFAAFDVIRGIWVLVLPPHVLKRLFKMEWLSPVRGFSEPRY